MPDPPLSAPGLSEILLWRRVSLTAGELEVAWKKMKVQM